MSTYQGKHCVKCGSAERYSADDKCVVCRRAYFRKIWKSRSRKIGGDSNRPGPQPKLQPLLTADDAWRNEWIKRQWRLGA